MTKEYKINYTELINTANQLKKYNGKLPLLIRAIITTEHLKTLQENGTYKEIINDYTNRKPRTLKEATQELTEWVQDHQEYKSILQPKTRLDKILETE